MGSLLRITPSSLVSSQVVGVHHCMLTMRV
jgi:hypothetical protein